MNRDLVLDKKSIMYKIISLGYPVYVGDIDNEFLITALVCKDCGQLWSMSRSECMFCGMENPHIYKCRVCGNLYSITRASKDCCGKKLVKVCINDDCITNTDENIRNYFDSKGGVFEINSSGATLNEMRCKHCGCKSNIYKTVLLRLVQDFNNCEDTDICYMRKNNESSFDAKYKDNNYHFFFFF